MTDTARLAELAVTLPPNVLLGTSTWNYPGWQGLVYHRKYKGKGSSAEMLDEYARFPLFRTVGIDSTFYAPPSPETLASYAAHLPPGFPCVSKVWDRITMHTFGRQHPTHAGQQNPDLLNASLFLDAVLEPYRSHFARHMGPFVFEFQAIPKRHGMGVEEFAVALDHFFDELPSDMPYAVELRNEEFLRPAYFDVLRRHRVAHVFNSWTFMPSIGDQLDVPGSITAPFIVARALMRPGRQYADSAAAFAPFDKVQEPYEEGRRDLLRLFSVATVEHVYILLNNRLEGNAPLTAVALAEKFVSRS